jgi:D-threonate/D-erythronate kinase
MPKIRMIFQYSANRARSIFGYHRTMTAPRITALADDATGALEVGCRLQSNGIPAEVWFAEPEPARGSLVIDTQTRHSPPAEARELVRRALLAARASGWIFKKTDSTLRGNIAAEIEGILDASACRTVVYVPAYPALGRTVVEGRLLIDGVPVERTAFAHDPLHPVRSGRVADLFAESGLEVRHARNSAELRRAVAARAGRSVVICDSSTDAEISEAARVVAEASGELAAAGPAPFAGELAGQLTHDPAGASPLPRASRGLVVNGSLHPASLQQIECAMAGGIPTAAHAEDAVSLLARHEWVILRPPAPAGIDPAGFSEILARETCAAVDSSGADTLILFGGETTFSVLRRWNIRSVEPQCEILPGVSLSCVTAPRPLLLLAKAGGFGTPALISELLPLLVMSPLE